MNRSSLLFSFGKSIQFQKAVNGLRLIAGGFGHSFCSTAGRCRKTQLCPFFFKIPDNCIDCGCFSGSGASCKNKESTIRCFSDCSLLHFIQNSSCLFLDQLNSVPDKLFILRTHNIQFIKHPGSVQFQIIILCRINDSFSAFFFQHQLPVNNHIHKVFLHIGFIYSQKSGTSCK